MGCSTTHVLYYPPTHLVVVLETIRCAKLGRRRRLLDVGVQVDIRNQNVESDVLSTG